MIQYCISICPENIIEAKKIIKKIHKDTHFIEIRADNFTNFDFEQIKDLNISNIIFSIRNKSENGYFKGTEQQRIEILKSALEFGFGFIDIEHNLPDDIINWFLKNKKKSKIIISYHNFVNTPENIEKVCQKIYSKKPDIIKIVTFAKSINDNLKVLNLIKKYKEKINIVFHSMGEYGEISRILGGLNGNLFTYSSLEEKTTAPGQISFNKLKNEYLLSRIKRNYKIYGLIGNPIRHSYSYLIHNFAFNKLRINSLYLNFLVDNIPEFLDNYLKYIYGLSITIPFKKEIINYLDDIDTRAKLIGAVNTVFKKNNKLIGYNTDYSGFLLSLKKYINPVKKRIVILGAGGSARAVIVSLLDKKNEIFILNRNLEKAKKLADEFNCEYGEMKNLDKLSPNIVVNCTPCGMYPNINEIPIDPTKLHNSIVYDLVYNPYNTKFLNLAKKNNITISGFEMFLRQAQEQFFIFTGQHFSFLRYKSSFLKKMGIYENKNY